LRTGSERFVAAAAAWEAFLFTIQLEEDNGLLDFRVAPTRFADIRRAIAEKLDAKEGPKREEKKTEKLIEGINYASPVAQS
jgi:hypothetical protein